MEKFLIKYKWYVAGAAGLVALFAYKRAHAKKRYNPNSWYSIASSASTSAPTYIAIYDASKKFVACLDPSTADANDEMLAMEGKCTWAPAVYPH